MIPAQAYSRVDRLLHRLAFRTLWAQQALGELENRLFADRLSRIEISRPVFVTSLPRAGTTLLLDVLNSLAEFSSHTYRDMPFVLCPLVWDQVSRNFRIAARSQERAHGDGMSISFDSPEAFEEILWRLYWPEKYHKTHIDVWTAADTSREFEQFFRQHVKKVIALRARTASSRYLSKNNANIARLDVLLQIFPDAKVLVPFRRPVGQASSLLRQHLHFLERHAVDAFAAQYMEWLGHYEFGSALRPLNFGSWATEAKSRLDPRTLDYWLTYWIRAYASLAECASPNVHFVDYDDMCREPEGALKELAQALEVEAAPLLALAPRFRAPTAHRSEREPDDALTTDALGVLEKLQRRSIQRGQGQTTCK